MSYEERDRLFEVYKQAVKEWTDVAGKMEAETLHRAYSPRSMEQVEDARFRALLAKADYETHVAKRRCDA